MLEAKASNQLNDSMVLAKKDVAVKWCANATNHSATYGGKPWRYVLVPHDEIAENISLAGLAARFSV
jgi:type III restriction enzyme